MVGHLKASGAAPVGHIGDQSQLFVTQNSKLKILSGQGVQSRFNKSRRKTGERKRKQVKGVM